MDRPDLELLVALDDLGTITAAAARLHTAQPALSRRLARIEREFRGVSLFERGRHGTVATPAGREVVRAARSALRAIGDVDAAAHRAASGDAGVLRLGATPTLGADELPTALARLRHARPNIHLELVSSGNSRQLRLAVLASDLDAALVALPSELEDGLDVVWRSSQHFVAVVPTDDPLSRGDAVPRTALRSTKLVVLRAGEGLRAVIDELFADLGSEPEVSLEAGDREMLLPAVAAGLGSTVVPERFARLRASGGTAIRPLDPPVHRQVGLVVRQTSSDPVLAALVDAVAG